MFTVTDESLLHPSIGAYIHTPFVRSFRLSTTQPVCYSFACPDTGEWLRKPGIHSTLRKLYYPNYRYSRRRRKQHARVQRKSSSKKQGALVDREIEAYIARGGRFAKHSNKMTRALIWYWTEKLGHTLQAAQLPVHVQSLDCLTQADVITEDKDGELHMWEVKTGFPPGGSRKKGSLSLHGVPNTIFNHWELQRHFTCVGLISSGLEGLRLENSHVINIYERVKSDQVKATLEIKVRKAPKWTLKLSPF